MLKFEIRTVPGHYRSNNRNTWLTSNLKTVDHNNRMMTLNKRKASVTRNSHVFSLVHSKINLKADLTERCEKSLSVIFYEIQSVKIERCVLEIALKSGCTKLQLLYLPLQQYYFWYCIWPTWVFLLFDDFLNIYSLEMSWWQYCLLQPENLNKRSTTG